MWSWIEIVVTSIQLWLYLQTAFIVIINLFCLSLPWLVWGSIATYLLIRFGIRVLPPSEITVKKVLGSNPFCIAVTEKCSFDRNRDETVCDEFCMRVVAHRGAAFDYPENSMTGLKRGNQVKLSPFKLFIEYIFDNLIDFKCKCHEKGCDAVEFDVSLTKDNIPILFHDLTTDRITGTTGTVKEMTWNELKDLDISINHPLRIKFNPNGERIALFEEVIEEMLQKEQRMFIDIKATGNEIVKVIVGTFKKYPQLYEKAAITSLNPLTIYMIRRKDPRIVAGIAWRSQFFSTLNYNGFKGPHEARYSNLFKHILAVLCDVVHDWAFQNLTYYILGLSFILLHKDTTSPDVIRQWYSRGVRVFAWTVNLPTEKIHYTKNLKIAYLTDTLLS